MTALDQPAPRTHRGLSLPKLGVSGWVVAGALIVSASAMAPVVQNSLMTTQGRNIEALEGERKVWRRGTTVAMSRTSKWSPDWFGPLGTARTRMRWIGASSFAARVAGSRAPDWRALGWSRAQALSSRRTRPER